ncbi:MAG: DegT/DnrJ/EryC1/StrS aminotransferase, partial [Microgenomates group bacterium GW2011_GWC1_37_12b]
SSGEIPDFALPPELKNTIVYWSGNPEKNLPKEIYSELKNRGIETRPFFYPMHRLPAYISEESFPAADYLFHHGINLPSGYNLTEGDIKYICAVIKSLSK